MQTVPRSNEAGPVDSAAALDQGARKVEHEPKGGEGSRDDPEALHHLSLRPALLLDRLDNGSYRYASWRRSKQTDTKPDLVIAGGKYDEEKGCYLFENDGYYYRVTTTESKNQLIVEKDGRTVLRQNIE